MRKDMPNVYLLPVVMNGGDKPELVTPNVKTVNFPTLPHNIDISQSHAAAPVATIVFPRQGSVPILSPSCPQGRARLF
jgi:hypothetical protein